MRAGATIGSMLIGGLLFAAAVDRLTRSKTSRIQATLLFTSAEGDSTAGSAACKEAIVGSGAVRLGAAVDAGRGAAGVRGRAEAAMGGGDVVVNGGGAL